MAEQIKKTPSQILNKGLFLAIQNHISFHTPKKIKKSQRTNSIENDTICIQSVTQEHQLDWFKRKL